MAEPGLGQSAYFARPWGGSRPIHPTLHQIKIYICDISKLNKYFNRKKLNEQNYISKHIRKMTEQGMFLKGCLPVKLKKLTKKKKKKKNYH